MNCVSSCFSNAVLILSRNFSSSDVVGKPTCLNGSACEGPKSMQSTQDVAYEKME